MSVNAKPAALSLRSLLGGEPQRLYGVLAFVAVAAGVWDELVGVDHELAAGADPEFGVDLTQVVFHRAYRQVQLSGDVVVG